MHPKLFYRIILFEILASLVLICFCAGLYAQPASDINAAESQIKNLIKQNNLAAADEAVTKLQTDFSGDANLTGTLCSVARAYSDAKQFEKAKAIYDGVASNYPEYAGIGLVNLNRTKLGIFGLIKADSFDEADAAVAKLKSDFAGNAELPAALSGIANRYIEKKQYQRCANIVNSIVADYPNYKISAGLKLSLTSHNICDLIRSGQIDLADAAVVKFKADFGEHPDYSRFLYNIGRAYEKIKQRDRAKAIFDEIAVIGPNNQSRQQAKLNAAVVEICDMIIAGKIDEANAALVNMRQDFANEAGLASAMLDIARRYEAAKQYDKAGNLFKTISTDYPNFARINSANLYGASHDICGLIRTDDFAAAETAVSKMKTDFAANSELPHALFYAAEAYYKKAIEVNVPDYNNHLFVKSAALLANDVAGKTKSKGLDAEAYYLLGLNKWYQKEYQDAAKAFADSINADTNHRFAGSMHWLISDCYEKLKAAGDVNSFEADDIIEWGYQTLFDNYPNCNIIDYAAIRLVEINIAKKNNTAACAYYCWLLMNTDDNDKRIDYAKKIFGNKCQSCGGCNK